MTDKVNSRGQRAKTSKKKTEKAKTSHKPKIKRKK